MEELHYERVDGEPKATQKSSFIKPNLAMSKGTSFFVLMRKTNLSFIWKLKPIPKPKGHFFIQTTWFFKHMEGHISLVEDEGLEEVGFKDEGLKAIVSISISTSLSLGDKLVSTPLDLKQTFLPLP